MARLVHLVWCGSRKGTKTIGSAQYVSNWLLRFVVVMPLMPFVIGYFPYSESGCIIMKKMILQMETIKYRKEQVYYSIHIGYTTPMYPPLYEVLSLGEVTYWKKDDDEWEGGHVDKMGSVAFHTSTTMCFDQTLIMLMILIMIWLQFNQCHLWGVIQDEAASLSIGLPFAVGLFPQ